MKYAQIPANTFKELQMNAGIIATTFNPATGEISGLLGATTGGINFKDTPSYIDLGEDIDNCPKNTKELKRVDDRDVKATGTFVSVSAALAKTLVGSASSTITSGVTKIVPSDELTSGDFQTLWLVGDYSDVNTGANAGFLAIKLINGLNTDGFQIQTGDKAKGQFAFGFTGHYSIADTSVVPYEIYIKAGEGTGGDVSILLDKHELTVQVNEEIALNATTSPAGQTVTWSSAAQAKATVTSGGVVKGIATGNTIVTASMTVDGVMYTDTCTVIVVAAE